MAFELVTAEMLASLIDNALRFTDHLKDPRLASWVSELVDARNRILTKLGGGTVDATLAAAQKEANDNDKLHDRRHRKTHRLLTALADDERPEVAAAATLVLRLAYADGLAFINRPFEVEVAYHAKFEERLRRPDVEAALRTLAGPLPELASDLAAITAAATALRASLQKVRQARLDKLGNPSSPELFAARRDALETWATFARVVDKVHKGDAPATRQARESLVGDWRRLLAAAGTATPAEDAEDPSAGGGGDAGGDAPAAP
ncbi:MAG: hypothetical protein JNJ59_12435 [Deltaproteobacteria bacterium]|jgi:hypothetical protein|nr:hypothetical protein [Deltaproteobacteria bacterium]